MADLRCPECGCEKVAVSCQCYVIFEGEGFDIENGPEFDEDNTAWCCDCDHIGTAGEFEKAFEAEHDHTHERSAAGE